MRRLLVAATSAAIAASVLSPVSPASAAKCGTEDRRDHPSYAFYWYECRRSETPDPDALPALDTRSGTLTVCVDRYHVDGTPKKNDDCRKVDLLTGAAPAQFCLPLTTPTGPLPCLPLPSIGGGPGHSPDKFPYDDFEVCTPDGSVCRDTFWMVCATTGLDHAVDQLACVGAGVQFTDPNHPERGVEQVCTGVRTPMDAPGTWTVACAPAGRKPHGHVSK